MTREEEILNEEKNAWYSAEQAKQMGYAVYRQDGKEIMITEITSNPGPPNKYPDLVSMGTVRIKDFVRTTIGKHDEPDRLPRDRTRRWR